MRKRKMNNALKIGKKEAVVLAIAIFLIILKLGVTGAQTTLEHATDFSQLFYGDEAYEEEWDEVGQWMCDHLLGGAECWASVICAGISTEGSQDDISDIENDEGILVTVDEEGNLIVGAQLSAGRSPPIRTFDEDTGEERWIRYYKVEYELRDKLDGEDTEYSISLHAADGTLLHTVVNKEEIEDGNTTSYLGSNRIVFAAEGNYKGILMTFEPEMESHGVLGAENYESLLADGTPVVIVEEGTTTSAGYGGTTPVAWGSIP